MAKRDLITQEFVKECFQYDQETGLLTRKKRTSNRINVGDAAGYKDYRGYLMVQVGGVLCSVHRVAWLYTYGEWPKGHVDHINRNTTDNRICNLRDVTPSENQHNRKLSKANKSGYLGVCWSKEMNKWSAHICKDRKKIYLGCYEDVKEAANAYAEASKFLHPMRSENIDGLPLPSAFTNA
jgi:citrate synthase